ncbi:MAG: TIGR01459 family HAD-type hydrolase [Granulosicoccus sp.]|nr:TIGR01459 family HAD-type hydrolase [Granulosicoccus sp.]
MSEKTFITHLQTLTDLVELYDAFLVDQFGVLLNGTGAYEYAPETLRRLSDTGKPVVLLSNSGKRSAENIQRLLSLGFSRSSFQTVLTSGEVAHSLLLKRALRFPRQETTVLVIGERPDALLDGLPFRVADTVDDVQLVLIAGSDPRHPHLDTYRHLLAPLAERGVDCLCTNPDTTRLTESGISFAPGAVAQLYEQMGGTVEWIGKPFPMMYEAASEQLGILDASRVLCIGDSPAHDIAGGQQAGFSTALVTGGIHAGETLVDIGRHCEQLGILPDHVLQRFAFAA